MPIVAESRLRRICREILLAMQTPLDISDAVADILVTSNLRGVDSHGSRMLAAYLRYYKETGTIVPDARPEIIAEDGAVLRVEGNWGWGQAAARFSAGLTVETARKYGVGVTSLAHVQHIGRLGEYSEQIARQGMLAAVVCNANRATTPFGGFQRIFGTNPLALALQRKNGLILSADFATSARSINKIMLYRQREQPLPEGIILNKNGFPTTDPNAFFDGGVLLAAGAYKGYALSLFIDIIGGILTGAGCAALLDRHPGNGTLFIAMSIDRWRPQAEFQEELEQLLTIVKAAPLAPGFEEVLLPGELEDRAEAERRANGIPLDEESWGELREAAAKLGLPETIFAA